MPPLHIRLHGRDIASENPIGPGQRVSIEGGIDSNKNIIAMILAIVLFIVVLVSYQYFATAVARREQEARSHRHKRQEYKTHANVSIFRRLSELIRRWLSSLKRAVSPSDRPSRSMCSSISMEALLKVKTRRPPPKRRPFLDMPCLERRKESQRTKSASRKAPRPLLLNRDVSYIPRSPIDEKTQEILRSPAAFAEFSDPVRNINFVRWQDEVERRKERDEIWYEKPLNAPEKPVVACVTPLAIRKNKKARILREGDDMEYEWAPPSPERVIYPSREPVVPVASSSTVQHSSSSSSSSTYYSPYSPQQLSPIDEESEPPAPRSFVEIDDDDGEDKTKDRRKKVRLRFPLPSPTKASLRKDADVFTIGSFSASEDSDDESGCRF